MYSTLKRLGSEAVDGWWCFWILALGIAACRFVLAPALYLSTPIPTFIKDALLVGLGIAFALAFVITALRAARKPAGAVS